MAEKTIFDEFTGKYQLLKTLRFELRPIWNTQQILDRDGIFKNDELRRKKYEAVKPWLDLLHREFIEIALKDFKFRNLRVYYSALQAWQKDKKSKQKKDALAKIESGLREETVSRFEKTASAWAASEQYKAVGLRKDGIDMLFEAGVFQLLKERFKNEEGTTVDGANIFDEWDKWTGYFKKFFETRKNFYKSDGTSTAVAYRIVNQNLRRFCENIQVFEEIKQKIDVSEVEKNFKMSCRAIFSLEYYNSCLLQKGIDAYNKIIGGELRNKDEKIRGINELVNKYRQDNPGEKIPFLKMLNKQIHGEKEAFIEAIENDGELVERLRTFYKNADTKIQIFKKLIADFARDYSSYDLKKIYLSKEAITHNASRWFENYESFERDLFAIVAEKYNKQEYESLRTHRNDSKISDKEGKLSFPDFIRCSHIKQALEKQEGVIWKGKYYEKEKDGGIPNFENIKDIFTQFLRVFQFELEQQFSREKTDIEAKAGEKTRITVGYEKFAKPIVEIIGEKNLTVDPRTKTNIKNFAKDAVLTIYQIAKYFAVEKRRNWLDNYELDDRFYKSSDIGYLNFYREAFEQIVRPYNLFRNYLTKKPYETGKWVLNFENPTLANGWDKNKERENSAVLFERDGRFILGIMHKDRSDLFVDENNKEVGGNASENVHRKMVYKYFPNPSQMIPKCSTQLKEVKNHFGGSSEDYKLHDEENFIEPLTISKRVYELNNYEYQKSYLQTLGGKNFDVSRRVKADSKKPSQIKVFQKDFLDLSKNETVYERALADWIDFCKSFLSAYRSTATSGFDYSHIKNTEKYESVDQFYRDAEKGSYKLSWRIVSEKYLHEKNEGGELFLFEIYNKDWGDGPKDKKRGRTKNLHTLYWEHLFSGENFKENFPFKLNGEAELFFRPATKGEKWEYKAKDLKTGQWKKVEKDKNGNLPEGAIIDHKRYTKDKIYFHCPITLNRVSENKTKYDIDADVRKEINNNPKVRIIGVDRGEKHLIYYSVIDRKGKIIKEGSLNAIGKDGKGEPVEYAAKLEKRALEREVSRRDWKEVEAIKDLRQGYMSQVVRKLADLIIEHNAIIVFEDLSMRFKQVRGGIEKSVYQQLEKALIDKLSFLVKKGEKNPLQAGHILRAYQLAAPVTAFKDMGKQTGVIFYTQAGYTSKTCPECGYRRNIKCRFENIEQAEEFIKNLESVDYGAKEDMFTIRYSLKKLSSKEQKKVKKANNELYAEVLRKDIFNLSTKDAVRYKWYDRYSEKAETKRKGVYDYKGERKESETKKGVVKEFNLTEYIKGVLETAKIDYVRGGLKEQILFTMREREFYQDFLFALFLLTETRHSISGTKTDYIQCAECGFDSRKGFHGTKEFNGDANGAYNIARKGIIILDKIQQFGEREDLAKMNWGDLSIGVDEWDKFAQNQWNPTSKSRK